MFLILLIFLRRNVTKIIILFFFLNFQIESLDDHSGRLLIKLALGGRKEWFNEFMVQPVSKAEYAQYGKVLSNLSFCLFFC